MNDDKLDVELDPQKVRSVLHRSDYFLVINSLTDHLRRRRTQLYIEMGEVEEEEVYNMEIADIRKMPRVKKKIRKRTPHPITLRFASQTCGAGLFS